MLYGSARAIVTGPESLCRSIVAPEESTMTEQSKANEAAESAKATSPDATERKQIDEIANEMAEKASHTEKAYDTDHHIFSK
jgi:acetyl-CoA carboxylase alpha subunit